MKYCGLLWAGLMRKKVRTTLTLLSIVLAFVLFGVLRSVADAFNAGVEIAGVERLIVTDKYSIINMMPFGYVRRIEQIPGVTRVAHATWFGGTYIDTKNFFPKFPLDAQRYLDLYPEFVLPDKQRKAFTENRQGAVAGRELADRFGWKIGDRIPIQADIWPMQDGSIAWEFDLVGIYTNSTASGPANEFWFNYDYFDEARAFAKGQVGWFIVQLADPAQAQQVAKAIDAQFANSDSETKTSTERDFALMFAKQVGDIGLIMTGILGAVFFTIILLTGNTMAQTIRERIPELAVLKTLGFTNTSLLGLVLAESVVLTLLGALLGLALSVLLVGMLSGALQAVVPGVSISWLNLAGGVGLALLLGIGVGLFPALTAMRLNIVDALRV